MSTMIRPRKDGGYSECSSPDELVGKGRCCHILGGSDKPAMQLVRVQRGTYEVNIEGNDESINIKAQKESIIKFFDGLSRLDDEKVRSIIAYLEEEG